MNKRLSTMKEWGKSTTLKLTFSRETATGPREMSVSVTAFGLLAPLSLLALLLVLAIRPSHRPAEPESTVEVRVTQPDWLPGQGPPKFGDPQAQAPAGSLEDRERLRGAPGRAMDERQDIITPLNVRDPTALVMGPSASPSYDCTCR